MSLLVVGTMAFDAIETPYGKVDRIIGGAATFIALAASYFARPVYMTAAIGNDFPENVLDDLRGRGVDTEGITRDLSQPSFFWSGKYGADLNTRTTLATELNVLATFNPTLPEAYRNAEFVLLGNLTPDIQRSIIHQMAKRPRLIAMDTMNFWMDSSLDSLLETIKLVDMMTINDEEARQLTSEYSLLKAARRIMDMGPRFVVIKKGEHGALLFNKDEVFFAPALPLEEVFDPTGAGDTFAGGLMGYLTKMNSVSFDTLKNAVIYGSTLASFCVEDFGPNRLFKLTNDDLRARYHQFSRLVTFNQDDF